MAAASPQDITELLLAWGEGNQDALKKLTPLVYGELHRLARHYMAGERTGQTLHGAMAETMSRRSLRFQGLINNDWNSRA
jgi:hypothetical protein